MEKHQYGYLLIFSIVVSLGIVSFVSCVIAESKKIKKEEVKLDSKLCYLPESRAFSFGFAALICLVVAQIIANLVICSHFWLRKDGDSSKAKKPMIIASAFLVLSWISFGLAVISLSTATSMSRKQFYGKGWLDQKCYLPKDGVFIWSGCLVLISIAGTIGTFLFTISKVQVEQARRVHAQHV
ncbi:protein MODIFYING WALL LIGNIN-2 [Hevea brasiliensis]|uniref:protein MODIFYING WALL LIGNIN-2 n=1 Tax=Hevea brasiliensis TaxID=3981 RepID=UPI000B7763A6|nr:protein MODIFYING WALL LIGNIN-2 [Hevea brasiliensis]